MFMHNNMKANSIKVPAGQVQNFRNSNVAYNVPADAFYE